MSEADLIVILQSRPVKFLVIPILLVVPGGIIGAITSVTGGGAQWRHFTRGSRVCVKTIVLAWAYSVAAADENLNAVTVLMTAVVPCAFFLGLFAVYVEWHFRSMPHSFQAFVLSNTLGLLALAANYKLLDI